MPSVPRRLLSVCGPPFIPRQMGTVPPAPWGGVTSSHRHAVLQARPAAASAPGRMGGVNPEPGSAYGRRPPSLQGHRGAQNPAPGPPPRKIALTSPHGCPQSRPPVTPLGKPSLRAEESHPAPPQPPAALSCPHSACISSSPVSLMGCHVSCELRGGGLLAVWFPPTHPGLPGPAHTGTWGSALTPGGVGLPAICARQDPGHLWAPCTQRAHSHTRLAVEPRGG